jgi:GTP cyclohydrolase I
MARKLPNPLPSSELLQHSSLEPRPPLSNSSLEHKTSPYPRSDVLRVDPETAVRSLLWSMGEDPFRDGLRETPARVAAAWQEWGAGYKIKEPSSLLKTFEEGGSDEMVLVGGIEFYSHCEHHMAPFFGTAAVAYIPADRKVVGLSKLARVVDAYAQRLQVQERLTTQIAECVNAGLKPLGVGVVLRAKHFCMCSRGVNKQGSTTTTSALLGVMRDPAVRAEFMGLALKD